MADLRDKEEILDFIVQFATLGRKLLREDNMDGLLFLLGQMSIITETWHEYLNKFRTVEVMDDKTVEKMGIVKQVKW